MDRCYRLFTVVGNKVNERKRRELDASLEIDHGESVSEEVYQDFFSPEDTSSSVSHIKPVFTRLAGWFMSFLTLFAYLLLLNFLVYYGWGSKLCQNASILVDICGNKLSPVDSVIRQMCR